MTSPTPVIAPYVPYYASREPYITVAEYLAAPTGVDTSQIIPGQGSAANASALATLIETASGYADSLCYQVLAATTDLQAGEYRVFRDGTIRVPVDYTPILLVSGVSLGFRAGQFTALTDLSGVWVSRKIVRIPVWGLSSPPDTTGVASAPAQAGRVFAQVTYVNGYPNTTLAAAAAAGASTIVVKQPLGIVPGTPLGIYDDVNGSSELVTAAPSYVLGSTSVPLAAPAVNAHAAGVSVSALPRPIKQAVICLTTHLIKTRGAESLALASVSGGPSSVEKELPGATEEYEQAVDLLHPFRRTG